MRRWHSLFLKEEVALSLRPQELLILRLQLEDLLVRVLFGLLQDLLHGTDLSKVHNGCYHDEH